MPEIKGNNYRAGHVGLALYEYIFSNAFVENRCVESAGSAQLLTYVFEGLRVDRVIDCKVSGLKQAARRTYLLLADG